MVVDWTSGFVQFHAWLPQEIARVFGPTDLPSVEARSLLTIALASFMISFVARTAWRIQWAITDWFGGRRMGVHLAGFQAILGWLAGFGAVLSPWVALKGAIEQGHSQPRVLTVGLLLTVAWAVLRSLERNRLYWLPADGCVVLLRSSGLLKTAEVRVPVARLLAAQQSPEVTWLAEQLGSDAAARKYLKRLRKKQVAWTS